MHRGPEDHRASTFNALCSGRRSRRLASLALDDAERPYIDPEFEEATEGEEVEAVRANVTIDWTVRENVRAHLRVIVKRVLRKYGYPPDKQEKATQTVLDQAEVLSEGWTVGWRLCPAADHRGLQIRPRPERSVGLGRAGRSACRR